VNLHGTVGRWTSISAEVVTSGGFTTSRVVAELD